MTSARRDHAIADGSVQVWRACFRWPGWWMASTQLASAAVCAQLQMINWRGHAA